jgi:hypothetical protein
MNLLGARRVDLDIHQAQTPDDVPKEARATPPRLYEDRSAPRDRNREGNAW